MLSEVAKRRRIVFFDFTDALLSTPITDKSLLYFDFIHLSPLGHEYVSKFFLEALKSTALADSLSLIP